MTTIGARIRCVEDFGTIKYIGEVDGYTGTWLGIDWDNPTRGKHNGLVKGRQYFCASEATSASFVRPEKIELGQSLEAAIRNKYCTIYDLELNKSLLLQTQHEMKAPFIELVGLEKLNNTQSDIRTLKIVSCIRANVSSIGNIRDLCPNLEELVISGNLLNNWSDIFDMCSQLPQLKLLNTSKNKLGNSIDTSRSFPSITTLSCESNELEWGDVLKLAKVFPELEELLASNNNITTLDTPSDHSFIRLKLLELAGNRLASWENICKVGAAVKGLEQLNLIQVELVSIGGEWKTDECFSNLTVLNVSNNQIDNWESFGELNHIKSLCELKVLNNPILETESSETRDELIIAQIASLQIIHGHRIQPDERKGAEYDYLKKYGLEYLKVKKGTDWKQTSDYLTFTKKYPRYMDLIQKYGEIHESELLLQNKTIGDALLSINITYEERTIVKKLPPTILIQKLIMLTQRLFRLDERPSLVYVSNKCKQYATGNESPRQFPMEDEYKDLQYYSIETGDTIIARIV